MKNSYKPVLRFMVVSDVHYKDHDSCERERMANAIKYAYEYAEKQVYKNLDALVVVGDFATSGSEIQMNAFKETLDKNLKAETKRILSMSSHEFNRDNGGEEAAIERFLRIFEGLTPDTHEVINGFHFVSTTTTNGTRFDDKKKEWISAELKAAAKDDRKKPIFVFQHPHVQSTVYGSILWGEDEIIPIYMNYPQIIDFSGHSHAPINDPRSIHQEHFTSLGTGTLSYFELDEFDKYYGTVPPKKEDAAQMLIVECDENYHVKIYPYDVLTHQFFPMVWDIETPWDVTSFRYTNERYKTDIAPYFEKDTKICIDEITENSFKVTFGQAKIEKEYVNGYYVTVKEKETALVVSKVSLWSEYYFTNMPSELSCTVDGLDKDTAYTVEITANSFWNTYSKDALKAEFKTL